MKRLAALFLLLTAPLQAQSADRAPAAAPAAQVIPLETAVIVQRFPHDPGAFTQGLFIDRGELFESTGMVGRSSLRKVDLRTGKVLRRADVPPPHFGEGSTPWNGQILSLTWHDGMGFRWDRKTFRKIASFRYDGEGWGLTGNGKDLILSDGTENLRFLDPATFATRKSVTVTFKGRPLNMLNELEWIDGQVFANVWRTDLAVRIDPASGAVVGVIDLGPLRRDSGAARDAQVPNGIAWDAKSRKLYMTGKEWPWLYEVRLEPTGRGF